LNLLAPLYSFADRLRFRRHGNIGQYGEDLAHRYLRRSGFIVAARNWRPPQGGGELDLIAWEGADLVFIEVKTRVSGEQNAPERDIDAEKMKALRRAAKDYVRRAGAETAETRFDVISITGKKLEHYRDAFPFTLSV
jgi:putative endonuclease